MGKDLIVKALLNAGCDIDFGVARTTLMIQILPLDKDFRYLN